MTRNLRAVREARGESFTASFVPEGNDGVTVTARYTTRPLVDRILEKTVAFAPREKVTAENTPYPLELVLVLDASSSGGAYTAAYREGMRQIVEEVTSVNDLSRVHISLLAYSSLVSLPWDYREELLTPDSRRFYTAQQKSTARQYGIRSITDEDGPLRYARELCVARPRNLDPEKGGTGNAAAVQAYVDDMERPPRSPEEGFHLVVGDNRPVPRDPDSPLGGNVPIDPFANGLSNVPLVVGTKLRTIGNPASPLHFRGGDVRTVAMVPVTYIHPEDVANYDRFNRWGEKYNLFYRTNPYMGVANWGEIQDEVVTLGFDCPSMPTIAGTSDPQELYDALDRFSAQHFTGTDEGLAWAFRLVAEDWQPIWGKDRDYAFPAPYHGKTEKKIIMIGGSQTAGYVSVIAPICDKLREHGVELYILSETTESMPSAKYCAGDRYVQAQSAEAFPEIMRRMSRQEKHVRLVSKKTGSK
jgi:hypothetical protein